MCEIGKKKDIYNFWEFISCDNCQYNINDNYYAIGSKYLYLYPITNCIIDLDEESFTYSKKSKLFFKDAIVNQNIIPLIIEYKMFDRYLEDFEVLLNLNLDIHILLI